VKGSRWLNIQRAVYQRDGWQCRMPLCACPDGRALDRALQGRVGPWAPSVDHIVSRSLGGDSSLRNLRAAHQRCNQNAAKHLHQQPATPKKRPQPARRGSYTRRALTYPVSTVFPGNQGSRW
jgi:5-methylcytosine-specific restriction endonuclease McrA